MLRDESMGMDEGASWAATGDDYSEWQDVDRELRSIARRQAGLDADLMRALREAERVKLWRHLGCVSMMEYLERVFGYSPRVAQERLRTARKLESLPELTAALADNELSFSAVRELSRIATPETERVWRGAARRKCLREIESLVSGLQEGNLPTDAKKPELMRGNLSFQAISPATRARLRDARRQLDAERGERCDDETFLATVADVMLAGGEAGIGDKAKHQIVRYCCDSCGQTEQLGGGVRFPIDEAEAERGECDAEHIALDPAAKPTQDIPKKIRRYIELRDNKRCRIPGCRSARNLEIHHIIHREDGGTHDPENLIVLCGGHHDAHHKGTLFIAGTASKLDVRRLGTIAREPVAAASSVAGPSADNAVHGASSGAGRAASSRAHVGASPTRTANARPCGADVEQRALAIGALKRLGWKVAIATKAVDSVLDERGADLALDVLICAALPRCGE